MKKKITMLFAALLACVGVMAQKAHQRVSHEGWVVTALNEAVVSGNEGGVAFIADDNAATFYHSNWSSNYIDGTGVNKGKDGLQAFMVELPHSLSDLSLITYKGRSDNNTSGWARGVRVYVYETLPVGWPAGGLSSLGYADKEALLASTNANLGTAAFDNTEKLWEDNRNQKLVEFATPQSGKYVLFIMESGHDAWLTCSDFQIYQYKEYTGIVEGNPYFLQVTNAAAAGQWFVDTYTEQDDNGTRNTIGISESTTETYFTWNEGAWRISTNENSDGNYLKIDNWCATPQSETVGKWELFINDDETISLLQRTYDGGGDNSRCFVGGDVVTSAVAVKLYTDNAKDKAINIKLVDAGATPVTVTYSLTYGGEEKYTQTVETFAGEEYPDFTATFPFGITATKPAGEIDANEAVEGKITKTIELAVEKELPFETAANANSITTWYYVKMHTNQPGYLGDIADDKTINVAWGKSSDVYSDNYVWGFVGNVFDGITVVNKGTELQLTSTGSDNVTLTENGTSFFVARTSETSANATNGFCLRRSDSNQYLNANYGAAKLSHWNKTDAGSTFFLAEYEETETTVSEAGWATMYLGYAVYIPEGVNAYTVASTEGGYATLTQLKDVIPANTGVLLENAGEYTFQKAAKDPEAAAGNLLQGSAADTYVEGVAYVLANGANGVGLYKATLNKNAEGGEGNTHFLNNAGKAYLVLPAQAEAPAMFSLGRGEGTTGIETAVSGEQTVVIYDLAGRRVEKMEKGIYIVNGKKVIR